ncbi:response regulator [Clostridium transplantifaecale]|uniref:response regulator n=1 Tax=Clostridium transplantifaecale TaxID=2479838 RepID=UPI0019D10B75|nr:response regulator [Clostridium transplantifaecale]
MLKKLTSSVDSRKLSKWTTILVLCLLLLYYMITLVNINHIATQVEMIGAHPFPVALEINDTTTDVARLNGLAERLTYIRTDDVLKSVRRDYEAIDKKLIGSLEFIEARYRYQPEDADDALLTYSDLRGAFEQFLVFCENPTLTNEESAFYFRENIQPKVAQMNEMCDTMILGVNASFAELELLAQQSRLSTVFLSTVLILAVVTSLFIYMYLLRKKHLLEEQLQAGLRDALAAAQNANAAKSQFLSNMSHDIRTPMNAIIGMTAIAGMNLNNPEKVKDCLCKVSVASTHLLGLINDVLDMSKIESGKVTLSEEDIILPELIQEFITLIQQQTKSKQQDFHVGINNLEHERVIGDSLRIKQILLNIMSNAVKFTPFGGEISLKIRELPPQRNGYGTYQFIISDTGVGMSEEFIKKIFLPFERAQSSTQSKVEGTGLGMAIVKSIVDMMNGHIAVQSQAGVGTVFQLTLHFKLQKTEGETFDLSALRELHILVVDDDQDVCEETTRMLAETGMCSEWALTGEEAVNKIICAHEAHQDYLSVIVNWKMPGMDGLEITRRIRSIVGGEAPIIILTAYDWTDIEAEANEAGINAFLAKPLFKSRLCHVLLDAISAEKPGRNTVETRSSGSILAGRILLVEDNAMNMEIALELIKNCGGVAESVWDGSEAVRVVETAPDGYYDLIFMDIRMPHMDGYEATRQIRRLEKEKGLAPIPIVAMSADAFVEDASRAYEAGMDGYITKPVSMTELNRVLREYLTERPE